MNNWFLTLLFSVTIFVGGVMSGYYSRGDEIARLKLRIDDERHAGYQRGVLEQQQAAYALGLMKGHNNGPGTETVWEYRTAEEIYRFVEDKLNHASMTEQTTAKNGTAKKYESK